MPDIDMDFDERRRGDMIRYATEKYGEERVAQIITYGTIKAKAAVKDAARVLGYPFALGDRITKAMPPPVMGKDIPLAGIFDPTHPRYREAAEFRALVRGRRRTSQKVVDTAEGLEGLKRQWGVHAAGVILSREPLLDVLPIQRREQDGAIITQFDMGACETSACSRWTSSACATSPSWTTASTNIKANRGRRPGARGRCALRRQGDLRAAGPRRHPRRVPARRRADALAAALDGAGQLRGHLRRARALPARARWAPTRTTTTPTARTAASRWCRSTRELAEPLADILGDTYGLIVYQEQVMAIAQKLAGYSLGAADLLRRAMGKKKKEILDKEYVPFSDGHARATATPTHAIKTLWDILVPFSDYAFNKAHTAGYGLVSYWTAYLKANYPAEYMAALLTSVGDDKDKSRGLPRRVPADGHQGAAAGRQRVATPTSPRSATDIRFGLAAVRNVGDQRGRVDRPRPAGARARSPTSTTSCARSTRWCATRRRSSR